nr:hypothetical protein [Aliiroseovarius sp. S1339]
MDPARIEELQARDPYLRERCPEDTGADLCDALAGSPARKRTWPAPHPVFSRHESARRCLCRSPSLGTPGLVRP